MIGFTIFLKLLLILSNFFVSKVSCSSCEQFDDDGITCSSIEALINYSEPANPRKLYIYPQDEEEPTVVVCDEAFFENFTSVIHLSLTNLNLLQINEECFSGLDGVENIVLDDNYLTRIDMGSFRTSEAMKVQTIDLGRNFISKIIFDDVELPELTYLSVALNRLKTFELKTGHMPKILNLNLEKNQISSFKIESKTLTEIFLRNNRIKFFQGTDLVLPNLENINLEENFLTSITPDMFANMPKLNFITISHNLLVNVSFPKARKFKDVDLGYNSIKTMTNLNLTVGRIESFLNLESNKIFRLERGSLNIRKVKHFYCIKSKINFIDKYFIANTFMSLKSLSLQYNYLQSADIFRANNKTFDLMNVYFSFNRIRKIGKRDFKRVPKLEQLYLDNNAITRIEGGAFDTLTDLKVLSLVNNLLFKLPANLFDRQNALILLGLTGNNMPFFPIPGWDEGTGDISNTTTLGKLEKLFIDMNPLQCQCMDLIKSWAKMKKIKLVIDNEFVRNGIQPTCIVNDQGCRTDVGKDFIYYFWHLFNNETYINMLHTEDNEEFPSFGNANRVFQSIFEDFWT
ncbi:chaoptin-like [Lutzomyia longipalpis]|uniref:chaoptin-like n=1 Tax=Lutzomyia longipalpis TaxID=7200 RepID=UPI002483A88F|nr:chaoptin-like [Lutzomyia longipalpis]